jgi:hypothetical protein
MIPHIFVLLVCYYKLNLFEIQESKSKCDNWRMDNSRVQTILCETN